MGDQLQQAASEPEVFLLYEGGKVPEDLRKKLTHVRVGPQVKEIPNGAFSGCDKLIELQLNEGLEVIRQLAFYECESLRAVSVPLAVTEVGWLAFAKCSSLIELRFNEGLQFIGASAFQECRALRSVTLPSTVIELRGRAFYGCSNLAEVQLNEGLQVISVLAFYQCTALRSMTLSSSVTELGEMAFSGCSNLIELQLNEGLQVIGERAFQGCASLRSATVPSAVTKLGWRTFCGCSSLIELQLEEGLQVIGDCAFDYCRELRSLTIPSTVTELGMRAFFRCINLSEVIFLGGKRLLNQGLVDCGFRQRDEQGLLNHEALDKMLVDDDGDFAFLSCPLTTVKISISWAVSERMARLPRECMLFVEERIHRLRLLELLQDGDVFACFPVVVSRATGVNADDDYDDETEDGAYQVLDTNFETARSLYQVLQLISFHELKESSILIELAFWKSTIDEGGDRAYRVAIPGPAKSLLMEYCGFAGYLRPAF